MGAATKQWYRRKIVAVQVMTFNTGDDLKAIHEWVGRPLRLNVGDSVVKALDGGFTVVGPDELVEMYDPIA